jgi:hypothetical protein
MDNSSQVTAGTFALLDAHQVELYLAHLSQEQKDALLRTARTLNLSQLKYIRRIGWLVWFLTAANAVATTFVVTYLPQSSRAAQACAFVSIIVGIIQPFMNKCADRCKENNEQQMQTALDTCSIGELDEGLRSIVVMFISRVSTVGSSTQA